MNHLNRTKIFFLVSIMLMVYFLMPPKVLADDGSLRPTLAQKVANTDYIFEAEIIDIEYFQHNDFPHTVYYLSIYKVFKGELPDTVELICYGGNTIDPETGHRVRLTYGKYYPGFKGNVATFFTIISDLKNPKTAQPVFNLKFPDNRYSYVKGGYTRPLKRASEIGKHRCYKRLEKDLYGAIANLVGYNYEERRILFKKKLSSPNKQ